MKIIFFDYFASASGDMIRGALMDSGFVGCTHSTLPVPAPPQQD